MEQLTNRRHFEMEPMEPPTERHDQVIFLIGDETLGQLAQTVAQLRRAFPDGFYSGLATLADGTIDEAIA